MSVDLRAGRCSPGTLGQVPGKDAAAFHIFETELTEEQLSESSVLLGVGCAVPCANVILAKVYSGRTPSHVERIFLHTVQMVGREELLSSLLTAAEHFQIPLGDTWWQRWPLGLLNLSLWVISKN